MSEEHALHAFRAVPRTGVIYVTSEAVKSGFSMGDAEWCNLGQGQPETGELPGAPPRVRTVAIQVDDQEYAPVAGLWELRETIASLYNALYRRGLPSQYSAENVAVSGGGRASLTRAAASLGHINLGHFLPDYTAYEELLDIFKAFTAIPILLEPERGYSFTPEDLRREILGRGLSALLLSNPCNPTGKLVEGDELDRWVETARELDCALLLDEFYSHYVYRPRRGALPIESAARYVEHVDRDPVLILDGLTKNWRYPGWRVTWSIGPKQVIEAVASAGSFLDGGGSKPLQRAAIPLLEEAHVTAETMAVHTVFREKRDFLLSRLERLGVRFDRTPDGTFYCWGSVAGLPPSMSDGMSFFRAALEHKVITVPGEFFDVNPGKRRSGRASRFRDYVRFSFGPSLATLEKAVARFEAMVATASS
ncbi:MAG: pyridoxal phosphate-dependent aminotransferase [Polyangiaceae bacterium]|jgi:N-succinyldiaminopimelate aminotransferase